MNYPLPPIEPPASDACALARAAIELARSDDVDSPRTKPAIEHVESCPACQQAVRDQQLFDRQVAEICRDVPLPAGLRERLLSAVDVLEPFSAPSAAATAAAIRPTHSLDKMRVRRRQLVSLAGAAICALLASGGWLHWHWHWHWQPPVDLDVLTLQAINNAPGSLPEFPSGAATMPLPGTMKTNSICTAPRQLAAGDAGLYFFSVAIRRRDPVEGRLLVVPAKRVRTYPAAAFLSGPAVYVGGFCTTAWTEGDFVYVCCVKGGEDNLRWLAPDPRTAT